MRILQQTKLQFQQGRSDKVYEVELCELNGTNANRFVVNFRYGRRNSALKEGSKTPTPVDSDQAQAIFDNVVVSKLNGGYVDVSGAPAPRQGQPTPPASSGTSSNAQQLLDNLASAVAENAARAVSNNWSGA
jgi:hypothetical protein